MSTFTIVVLVLVIGAIATFVAMKSSKVTDAKAPTPAPTEAPTLAPGPCIECDDMYNNTGSDLNGINYTDCGGTQYINQTVGGGDSICVQQGTLSGGDSGFLINLGLCSMPNNNVPDAIETKVEAVKEVVKEVKKVVAKVTKAPKAKPVAKTNTSKKTNNK